MSIPIVIQNSVIDFPSSAQDPNYAPGIIQFAQAVEQALASVVGPFDIPPTIMNIDSYDVVTNQPITDSVQPLSFPVSAFPSNGVRAAFIRYAVYRTSTATTVTEAGNITLVYNPDGSPVWQIQREYIAGANISFSIDATGQMFFTTTTIGGTNHVGRITYVAQALKQA